MSLDDLFGALVFLLFVVGPILRGLARRRRGGDPPTDSPADSPARPTTARPGRRAPAPSGAPVRGEGAGEAGSTGDAAGDLDRRIEEARRRVREALEGEERPGPSAPAPLLGREGPSGGTGAGRPAAGPAPSLGPLAPSGPMAPVGPLGREGAGSGRPAPRPMAPSGPLGREGTGDGRLVAAPMASRGPLGREGAPPRPEPSPALRSERRRASSRAARVERSVRIGLEPDEIARGFLWSIVLSEPRSRTQLWRIPPSRPRSP